MTTDQLNRRTALLARKDAALVRWSERRAPEHAAELESIAREMDELARAMDGAEMHPLERLRTWRCTADVYLSLGTAPTPLRRAAHALRTAEALADSVPVDVVELLDLKHKFGSTLFKLSAGEDAELAAAAARHLSTALALARKHRPVGVAEIKLDLFRAEHAVMKLATQAHRPATARRARSDEAVV
jgi:hypothetical protein